MRLLPLRAKVNHPQGSFQNNRSLNAATTLSKGIVNSITDTARSRWTYRELAVVRFDVPTSQEPPAIRPPIHHRRYGDPQSQRLSLASTIPTPGDRDQQAHRGMKNNHWPQQKANEFTLKAEEREIRGREHVVDKHGN